MTSYLIFVWPGQIFNMTSYKHSNTRGVDRFNFPLTSERKARSEAGNLHREFLTFFSTWQQCKRVAKRKIVRQRIEYLMTPLECETSGLPAEGILQRRRRASGAAPQLQQHESPHHGRRPHELVHWSITSFVTSFVTKKIFVMRYELRNHYEAL